MGGLDLAYVDADLGTQTSWGEQQEPVSNVAVEDEFPSLNKGSDSDLPLSVVALMSPRAINLGKRKFDRQYPSPSNKTGDRGKLVAAQECVSTSGAAQNKFMTSTRYLVKVWGSFDLKQLDGFSIRPTVRKACALLALLALSSDHRLSRKWVQSILWSNSSEVQGSGSLRQELARLKRLLGKAIQSDNIDIWLDTKWFHFDHLDSTLRPDDVELLQGIDIDDEAFEDWLRDRRQFFANQNDTTAPPVATSRATNGLEPPSKRQPSTSFVRRPRGGTKPCTVIFDSDAKGGIAAEVAAMRFSEILYNRLNHYDIFSCLNTGLPEQTGKKTATDPLTVIARIRAVTQGAEVYLAIQLDWGMQGERVSYQSALLPAELANLHSSTEIGRLVQHTMGALLDTIEFSALPQGSSAQAIILANQAQKLMFKLDKDSLAKADTLLAHAYEIDPQGQYIGWRGFLRNTAFFQHRNTDIFEANFSSEELSLEALRQAPENSIVQAFSSQLDYVNQGNLTEPMIKAQRAVEIDASDPLARALLSNALTVNGHIEEGYQVAQQAIALAKGSAFEFYFHHFACMAATAAQNYEVALVHARSSVGYVPDFVSPRRYEVILAQKLGDQRGVDHAVKAMRRTEPDFHVKSLLDLNYPVNTLRRLPIIEAIG